MVVGQEMDVDTTVTINGDRVFNVITIEGDGSATDGRCERMLQEAHLIIVDVDVSEDVLRNDVQDVTSLKEIVNT